MTTLKQLVDDQLFSGMTDMQIILTFLDINNMEEEAMDLINDLTKTKVGKLKEKQRMIQEWLNCLPSKYLYENYDLETADKLHNLELDFLSRGGDLSKGRLEWAKENVPNILEPQIYFQSLVAWLKDAGVQFKKR